jgi:hypothetical protein
MANNFDNERRRKAFIYTAVICTLFFIAFIFINWKVGPVAPPIVQELIEINLGNDDEGLGDVQPLIKGETSPEETTPEPPSPPQAAPQPEAPQTEAPAQDITADDKISPVENAPVDAAPVAKPINKPTPKKIVTTAAPVVKTVVKPIPNPTPAATPTPKPKIAKSTYKGPGNGGGNGAKEDNSYTMQGNKPGGTGDKGGNSGNKDTYGDKTSTKVGGPKVISGNRKVIKYYSFTGELEKATINAVIKVSPEGVGTFLRIGQGSTTTNSAYANAIRGYLQSMKFDAAADESTVTVQFNFNVQ